MSRAPLLHSGLVALLVLLLALVLGTGLRVYAQNESPNVQHDEAWSYASAAGRLGPFLAAMNGGLTGRWVPAGEWQYYWQSDRLGDFTHIGPDLAAYDVHPPLYFGLLHVWLQATGMHKWAGPALNLVFAALTMLSIYGLARQLGFERLEGSLAALVWAVSPAVVGISALTRQYDLVALTATLLVWGLVRAAAARPGRRRWPDVVWVAAASCAALLTHYQTILLVAGGVLFALAGVLLPGDDTERRPGWPPILGLGVGTFAAALLAPGWPQAFGNESGLLVAPSLEGLAGKLAAIAQTLGRSVGAPGLIIVVAAIAAIVVVALPRPRRALVERVRHARPGWWTILFFLAVTAGGILLQNLLFLSMPMRLSDRYLAMAWPLAAFIPLLVFGIWPRLRAPLTAGFCLLVLLPITIVTPLIGNTADHLPIRDLADADAVIVDGVGAGRLPRFLWPVPADTPVFVGDAEEILDSATTIADTALPPGSKAYYVSLGAQADAEAVARRDRVLTKLRETADVRLAGSSDTAEIYEITPRGTQ